MKRKLSEAELCETRVGEVITLTSVMAVLAIAVTAVVIFRIFKSSSGSTTIPGGWKFEWK